MNTPQQQHHIPYLALCVALMLPSATTGLQVVSNTNNPNHQRPQQQQQQLYFTSVAKNKCNVIMPFNPRSSSSSSSSSSIGYQRHPHHGSMTVDYDTKPLIVVPSLQRSELDMTFSPSAVTSPATFVNKEQTDNIHQAQSSTSFHAASSMVSISKPTRMIHMVPSNKKALPPSALASSSSPSTSSWCPSRESLVMIGCAMAMNSGFLNGLGLSGALGKVGSISAVTGTFTNSAVAYSIQCSPAALGTVLFTPLCYMMGSALNGWLNYQETGMGMEMGKLNLIQTTPLILAGILMTVANLLLKLSTAYGGIWTNMTTAMILPLLTFGVGMHNSWTSMMLQGNLLRTAHFSGITSDLGTVLGQVVHGNTTNAFKLPIFTKLLTSFWLGGMMSVLGTKYWSSIMTPSTCLTVSSILYLTLWTVLTQPIRYALVQSKLHLFAMWTYQVQRYRSGLQLINYWWKETHERRGVRQQQRQSRWGINHA